MKKFILLSATVLALVTGSASASDYSDSYKPGYKKVVTYKTVVTYVEKEVPYTVEVVKYDSYGKAYKTTVTKYKTVEVPVKKQVPVVKYVPAY